MEVLSERLVFSGNSGSAFAEFYKKIIPNRQAKGVAKANSVEFIKYKD